MSFGRVGGAEGVRGGLDFDGAAAAGPELGQFSAYLSAGRCGQARRWGGRAGGHAAV